MTNSRWALLSGRGAVRVSGEDAEKLLQGVITTDMGLLTSQRAIYAGLLTPQGKILLDFFVVKDGAGFLLELASTRASELVKRLTLYKLRAKVMLEDVSPRVQVVVVWGGGSHRTPSDTYDVAGDNEDLEVAPVLGEYADPRLPDLGQRWLLRSGRVEEIAWRLPELEQASEADYHAHRIALGVPEAEFDYALGDTFPHEACFDVLGGVSFDKGCFIGQEVVSRMEHRGTARKRFVMVSAQETLPPPRTEISAGAAAIGAMGSSAGTQGLALVRLDRAAEALQAGTRFVAGEIEVSLAVPPWAPYALAGVQQT